MACEVCEHCQGLVSREQMVMRDGYSYHKNCHKCYVCSETNLTNADVFKGVIFCSSCSQRIFQGCSTAKRTKNVKPKREKSRLHRRRDRFRVQDKRNEELKVHNGIIELAGLAASTDSGSKHDTVEMKESVKLCKTLAITTELALQVGKQIYEGNTDNLKKGSAEMGMTTKVTQELLEQMNCPVVNDYKTKSAPPRRYKLKRNKVGRRNKIGCSDLRVAELGMSTEIANMTLKYKSELPVIIKSESPVRLVKSLSASVLNQESDTSSKGNAERWLESTNTSTSASTRSNWKNKRLSSIMKIPYKCFRRNILHRSSLVNVNNSDFRLVKRFKRLLKDEVAEHQKHGVKQLYSTIIRRKTPYKLGWLKLVENSPIRRSSYTVRHKRCKHFEHSHSYRCMRTKVMRLAGPTKSELAGFRLKVKSFIAPAFMKNIIDYNNKYAAIMMSQACGSEPV